MSPPRAAPPIRWTRSPPRCLYEISIQAWTTHLLSRPPPLLPQCRHNNFHPTQSLSNESAPIPPSTPLGSSTAKRKSSGRGVATSHTGVSRSRATTSNRRHQHRQHRRSPDDFARPRFKNWCKTAFRRRTRSHQEGRHTDRWTSASTSTRSFTGATTKATRRRQRTPPLSEAFHTPETPCHRTLRK